MPAPKSRTSFLKPFPRFTNVTFYRNNVGNTNYNALQAKLGAPNTVLGAAGFGSITSAGDPRVLQFGLKVNF